jgi:cbb3-type cytochrome oxidase maturation protein
VEIIFLLIVVSLVLLGLIAWGFLWAVSAGQFEDLEAQGRAILMDEDEPPP